MKGRNVRLHSLTTLLGLKSGMGISFIEKTKGGFVVVVFCFSKAEKKTFTENIDFRRITTLFVEAIDGPLYIKE